MCETGADEDGGVGRQTVAYLAPAGGGGGP